MSTGRAALRLLVSHLIAYPIAMVWALASIPPTVVGIAARAGTTLEDQVIAGRTLAVIVWPAAAAFIAAHALGVAWARAGDGPRGLRAYAVRASVLTGAAIVGGGASWIWLMTR
jgi:hypothetical protein